MEAPFKEPTVSDPFVPHPHADPDGYLRDGGLRGEFFRLKVTGVPFLDIVLVLSREYNTLFFNGELPDIPFEIVEGAEFDYLGSLRWDAGDGPRRVCLNALVFTGYETFRDTLVHEMCHQYIREVLGDRTEDSHGPQWIACATRCGVYIEG